MRRCFSRFVLVLAVATPLLVTLLPCSVHADTYAIYQVGSGNSEGVYGLTDSGVFVLYGAEHCAPISCYSTFSATGMLTGTSATAPALPYDNGAPCVPHLPGTGLSVCNGGFAAFGLVPGGLYGGPVGFPTFLHSGSVDQLAVNVVGDFLWTDGRDEENYLAIDLTQVTPEPSTLALLGSGCLAIAGALRRRLFQS